MGYIAFQFPTIPSVHCYFQIQTQHSADRMEENIAYECALEREKVNIARKKLWKECSFSKYIEVKQVHGVRLSFTSPVYAIEETTENTTIPLLEEADGIATNKKNTALLIKTADCQSILFTERSGKYIMALHVGWRANAQSYIQKAVAEFCSAYGLDVKNVFAVRGPSLSPEKSEFINVMSEWNTEFLDFYTPENRCMDLWSITTSQLKEAGIASENIFSIDICTYSSTHFFSYRRNNITGRQGSFIIIKEPT